MPLSPDEILQRRLSDPYYGIAEEALGISLSEQKKANLASASVEKRRKLDPAAQASDEAQQSLADAYSHMNAGGGTGLLDIAQSALFQSREHLFDMVPGSPEMPEGVDRNKQIQELGDFQAGVTPETRERLVGAPQQKVVESLAAGNYGDAALQSLAAAPGTLADSAGVLPELALGALATYVTGGAAAPVLARRVQKGAQAVGKITDAVSQVQEKNKLFSRAAKAIETGVKAAPKAAGQVSIATADITQRQINDFKQEHGVDPTRAEATQMYALNMLTMLPQPSIIKNLLIPKFTKEIGKEIRTIGKNLVGGSNFGSIVSRIFDGTKKVAAAGGAEAAQEYFQTWAENLNVGMGPEQRKNFAASLKDIVQSEDAQMQALVGAFLGGGAGAGARGAITVPAVAAGTAVDVVKGTAKTAANIAKNQANKASLKVLSEEDREILKSEHESRKVVAAAKISDIDTNIEIVKNATDLAGLKGNEGTAELANALQVKKELTDEDLKDPGTLQSFKKELERTYKADKLTIQTEVEASNIAAIAAQAGKNVKDKSVQAAKDAVAALDVDVDQIVEKTKQYGSATVNAVKGIESSVGLGVIELAGRKTKQGSATALKAAQDLSLTDLNAVSAVVGQIDPKMGKKLRRMAKKKAAALKRSGLKRTDLIAEGDLPQVVTDINTSGNIKEQDAGAGATALNRVIASNISDVDTLNTIEGALKAYKDSDVFKNQTAGSGVMSPQSMAALEAKLARKGNKLRKPGKRRVLKFMAKIKRKGIIPVLNETGAAKQLAEAYNSDTAKGIIQKMKDVTPDLIDFNDPEAVAALEKKIEAGLTDTVKTVKKTVVGPETAQEATAVTVTPELAAKLRAVEETTKDPVAAKVLVGKVDNIYNALKKNGIESRDQWNDVLKDFPGLQNDNTFFTKLDHKFPNPMAFEENTDTLATTEADVKEAYNKMNPPECKI